MRRLYAVIHWDAACLTTHAANECQNAGCSTCVVDTREAVEWEGARERFIRSRNSSQTTKLFSGGKREATQIATAIVLATRLRPCRRSVLANFTVSYISREKSGKNFFFL